MATYYVDKIGAQIKYRLGAWPDAGNGTVSSPNDLNQVCFDININNEVVLAVRTWSGTEIDATDGLDCGRAGQTLRGPLPGDVDYATRAGTPILDGTGLADYTFANSATYTIKNLKIIGADTGKFNVMPGANLNLYDVIFDDAERGIDNSTAGITINATRCQFVNLTQYAININNATSVVNATLCLFSGNNSAVKVAAGTYVGKNNLYIGSGTQHISCSGNTLQVITDTNSIFGTWGVTNSGSYGIENLSTNAAVTISNYQMLGNPRTLSRITNGTVTLSSGITNNAPMFVSHRRKGIITISVDDNHVDGDGYFAEKLATLAEGQGFKISWGITTDYQWYPTPWDTVRDVYSRGHEICSHSAHHVDLGDRRVFDIQYIGSGSSASLSYSRVTKLFACSVVGAADGFSYDTTGKELWQLKEHVEALFSGASYVLNYVVATNNGALAEDLATITATNIKTAPLVVSYDETAFFGTEITGSKNRIEAEIPGWNSPAVILSVGGNDAAARAALNAEGYIGARWLSSGDYLFSSYRIYSGGCLLVGDAFGLAADNPSDDDIRRRVHARCDYLKYVGGHFALYCHGADAYPSDYPLDKWAVVLQAIKDNGIDVMPLGEAYQYIIDHAESTSGSGGEIAYLRSEAHLGDASDYRLRPKSPCRNAGAAVGLTTDYAGNALPVGSAPDIGLYEAPYLGRFALAATQLGIGLWYGWSDAEHTVTATLYDDAGTILTQPVQSSGGLDVWHNAVQLYATSAIKGGPVASVF